MSDRMTDERLAELNRTLEATVQTPYADRRELHVALVAERAEVGRLGEALDWCQDSPASDETSEVLIECNRLEARVVRLEAALTDLAAAIDAGAVLNPAMERAEAVLAEGDAT